ncbi:galactose mutarotase-like protein [Coniophora puteana RWD-64-598 SS2]|uniref:Galactose mutarotase-like protein n=1 Tax=Coniophora puteana (strain RWD-64-598) TaxID=741705 RepID=A0A5M3MZQ2_CONPW|nr:galactose mutarotase-like protein [Coniophora puteana RWD-64-598 SS2]EIW84609.1 galactose mutarotase-like protein [Coniophora puteana RWD-64-598 SS2]
MAEFKPVLLTLPSLTPPLAVEVLPFGLTIHRVYVQADGKTHDIVIGPEDPQGHTEVKYVNTVIGRYANRVPVGTHNVSKDGIQGSFTTVTNESPEVSLHGGLKGWDFAIWSKYDTLSDATLFTKSEVETITQAAPGDASAAIFHYTSPDGEEGYEGTLLTETLVALVGPRGVASGPAEHAVGSVVIVYRSRLQEKDKVTPINLTQHWGFNLDASLKDDPEAQSILNHRVTLKASHIADRHANFLPTGNFIPVAEADNGSLAHVHDGKRVGDNWPSGAGYDDYYVLSERTTRQSPHRIKTSEFGPSLNVVKDIFERPNENVLELSSEKSGLAVKFDSNQDGLMFYTNNFSNEKGYRKKIHGGTGEKGDGYRKQSATFIEFHEPLAAFKYPTTTSTDTLLTSNEIYNNYVRADVFLRQVEHTGAA